MSFYLTLVALTSDCLFCVQVGARNLLEGLASFGATLTEEEITCLVTTTLNPRGDETVTIEEFTGALRDYKSSVDSGAISSATNEDFILQVAPPKSSQPASVLRDLLKASESVFGNPFGFYHDPSSASTGEASESGASGVSSHGPTSLNDDRHL